MIGLSSIKQVSGSFKSSTFIIDGGSNPNYPNPMGFAVASRHVAHTYNLAKRVPLYRMRNGKFGCMH